MVEHLLDGGLNQVHSRLGLAVVAGTLESMSEATHRHLGHTYLCCMHSIIQPEGLGMGVAPYCTKTTLMSGVLADLRWWKTFLESTQGRFANAT
jgi:hypothetical protein